jgi:hypothetical protein
MKTVYARPHVPKRRLKNHEANLQRAICRYLRSQYPHVIFRSDGGGLPLSQTQAGLFKSMQSTNGFPDLVIYQPSRGYHALMIELKKDGTTIYQKIGKNKGKLVANPHIRNQAQVLQNLHDLGYCARFGVGYDHTVKLIDWYFCNENTELF